MSEEIMLTEQQQAEALHKQITGYGEVIYQSLYGMCTAIKQMRDSKLYRALGFDTFEAYTEEKLGMNRNQAYKYIAIADKLSEEFVSSRIQIGMTKLTLLTALTDDQRAEIAQTVDLESTTVRKLREQIAALKEESELDRKERDNANDAAQRWKNTAQSAQADNQRLEDQVQSLTDQVKEALPATPDAIGSVNIDNDHVGNAEIYGISGIRQNTMQKGMNIIRTANGKVKKVYVK